MPSTSTCNTRNESRTEPRQRVWWHWFTWMQFSTRSLLVVVVLAAFGSLYLRHTLRASRQREGLARLAKTASVIAAERNGTVVDLKLRFPEYSTLTASDFDGIAMLDDLESLVVEVDYLSPGALEPVRSCSKLFELELVGDLPDITLAHLPPALQVSSLAINRTNSDSPKEAVRAATRWPSLRKLTLQGIGDDPTVLDVASPENKIRELSLVGGTPATNGKLTPQELFLRQLPHWRNLQSLQLLRLKLRGAVDVPSLGKVERLSVAHCDASETTLDGLVALPELRFLRLWNCVAKPPHIGAALRRQKLTEFELLSLDADGKSLSGLSDVRALERLTLSLNLADDAMLRSLAECPAIKEVELVNLAGERTLPNLKRVHQVEEEIERILQARKKP